MRLIAKTLGALALSILVIAATIIIVALALWVAVPVAFPAPDFGFTNAVGLAGLLYLAKAVFA